MRRSATTVLLAATMACSGTGVTTGSAEQADARAAAPAGTDAGDGAEDAPSPTLFLTVLHDGNGLCLPRTLPTGSDGRSTCSVFYVLPGTDTCDAHAGLADADAQAAAAVRSFIMATRPAVCAVPQLGGDCRDSTQPGWCYLTGSAAGTCAQTIDITPIGQPPPGALALLGCP